MRKKITEMSAKKIMEELRQTGDLCKFVSQVSEYSTWYGRFGYRNRGLFIGFLHREIRNAIPDDEETIIIRGGNKV